LIIAPSLILAISVSLYSKDILSLLYLDINEQSSAVLSLLMLSLIPISTTYVFGTLLTANDNLKHLNLMAFAGILINIGLNLILIPSMKAEGAAVASVVTQFAVAIIQVFLIQYIFKFRVNYPFLLSILLLAGLLVGFGQFTKAISGSWMLNIGILVMCTTATAFLLKLISVKSVIGILKGRE
jgi:O-antigen/teichoic acid export membrane protein